jgi:hypothetical protein
LLRREILSFDRADIAEPFQVQQICLQLVGNCRNGGILLEVGSPKAGALTGLSYALSEILRDGMPIRFAM